LCTRSFGIGFLLGARVANHGRAMGIPDEPDGRIVAFDNR